MEPIKGFSKLSKKAKIEWLVKNHKFSNEENAIELLEKYWHPNTKTQKLHDDFAENTLSNFYMPFGIAPNFLINGKLKTIPMVIEESSVVAAASKAAGFWLNRGGFNATVISTTKIGHIHLLWKGANEEFVHFFETMVLKFTEGTQKLTQNMQLRGGGILDIKLVNKTGLIPNYFQVECKFETCDSMGANFINSVLEEMASILKQEIECSKLDIDNLQIIMCILSNYTPECIVKSEVRCKISEINEGSGIDNLEFANKFITALNIAKKEPYRAVTHNKGIMNGIDSVVIATGNDFRATEACAHAYAAKDGSYTSLTHAKIDGDEFVFWIEIPIAIGTVGGITALHPMVKFAHQIMNKPNAEELMKIVATCGLAQNFSALRSLTTTGIQKGHMKMHLLNILNQLEATQEEKVKIVNHFKDKTVSHQQALDAFYNLRGIPNPQKIKNN